MELPNLDLSNLIIGGVSLAPIIFLLVEGLKRANVLTTRDHILAAVVTLATAGYALSLVAQANPAIAPVFALVLQLGQALLSILVPAGSAVLIHRAARAARNKPVPPGIEFRPVYSPKPANPFAEAEQQTKRKGGKG